MDTGGRVSGSEVAGLLGCLCFGWEMLESDHPLASNCQVIRERRMLLQGWVGFAGHEEVCFIDR